MLFTRLPEVFALIAVASGFFLLVFLRVQKLSNQIDASAKQTRKEIFDTARQSELLQLLRYEIDLKYPLPPTRGWAASPDFLLLVARHAIVARPQVIVECGSGVSTIVLAQCCKNNGVGHVFSIDHNIEYASQTDAELRRRGLDPFVTIVKAPLGTCDLNGKSWMWYQLSYIPEWTEIDMLIIDGPPIPIEPMIRYPAGPILLTRLAAQGRAFLDDGDRADERAISNRWTTEIGGLTKRNHPTEKGCIEFSRTTTKSH